MVVRFVDIGGIVDHDCLNFLSITVRSSQVSGFIKIKIKNTFSQRILCSETMVLK